MEANANHRSQHWPLIVEGILLILFGLVALAWPGMTLLSFTFVFGLYVLFAGVVGLINGIMHINKGWSAIGAIVLGALFIAAGAYIFRHTGISAVTLVLFVGFTFIFRGIYEIVAAIAEPTMHRGLAITSGVLALLAGLILLRYPVGGGLAYVWVVGIYALVSGPILIAGGMGAGQPVSQRERA